MLGARRALEEATKALDEGQLATAIHACNARDFNGEAYTCELLTEAQRVYKVREQGLLVNLMFFGVAISCSRSCGQGKGLPAGTCFLG